MTQDVHCHPFHGSPPGTGTSNEAGPFGQCSGHTGGHRVQLPDDTLASRIGTVCEGGSCKRQSGLTHRAVDKLEYLKIQLIGHQELEGDSVDPWGLPIVVEESTSTGKTDPMLVEGLGVQY